MDQNFVDIGVVSI